MSCYGRVLHFISWSFINWQRQEKNIYTTTYVLNKHNAIFIKYIYMWKNLESTLAHQIVHDADLTLENGWIFKKYSKEWNYDLFVLLNFFLCKKALCTDTLVIGIFK